jgi:PAS domain S-box-containing protein
MQRMLRERFKRASSSPAPAGQAAASGASARTARQRYLRLVVFSAVVVAAMFIASLGAVIWQLRQNAITDASLEIAKLNHVLAEQTERSLQSCDLVLESIVEDLTDSGPMDAEQLRQQATGFAFHQALREKLGGLPQAIAIGVVNAEGDVLNVTREFPLQAPINVADRDYFLMLRDHPEMQRFIAEPVESRAAGIWTFYLARRINGAGGTFIGVVFVALEVKYFEDFYREVNPGEGSIIALWRNDGQLLARYPAAHDVIGRALPQTQTFRDIANGGGTSLVWTKSRILQDDIAVAERSLRDYPLITTVARSETAILATWRSQALVIAASAAAVALAIGFVAWLLYRQFVAGELVAAARVRADEETEARRELQRAIAKADATRRELERSEARFRDIAEVAADMIWETDCNHRFTTFTSDGRKTARSLRDPRAEALGKTRWEFAGADPETDDHWRQHKADLEAHRTFRQFRFSHGTPDGTTRHVSVSGKPVFDESGAFCGFRGTATNETAIIEAQQRARRADALLRDAVDSISEGFVIYDDEDRLVMCNEAYRRLYPDNMAAMVPGARFEDVLRNGLASGLYADASGRNEAWLAERLLKHREPDGPIESRLRDGRWALVSERRMASGGIAGLRIDITALKEVQASLRESQAQLSHAQRVSNTGSMVRDFRSDRAIWSDQLYRIFGLDPNKPPPTLAGFLQLVHPDDRAMVEASIASGENGIRQPALQYRIIRPDGAVRWVHREVEAILDAGGKPVGIHRTLKDITEQRAAEQRHAELERQLRHSQKLEALGTLAGGIAHDLNNTLVPILALSKIALKTLPSDNPLRQDLGTIVTACERARDLVRQILAFSRKQELVKQQIDLGGVTRESLHMMRASLPRSIQLAENLAEVPPMLGDAGQLQQVIVNLVANAAHAIGERPGVITVALSPVAGGAAPTTAQIRLTVADTGCGIAEDSLGRIFEPFFTTKPVGEGTGLGLSVVHGIVTGHGGSIDVHSTPGKGTEFSILLPATENHDKVRTLDRSAA